ncbi:hypothetical protein QL285_096657 [Trifolium repens]|nr:hypothetical protein QL285_096657 [Trifolium repens]
MGEPTSLGCLYTAEFLLRSFRSAELRLSEDPGLFHTMLSTSQKLVSQSAALCTTSHSKDNCCVPAICTITPLQRGQLRSYP